MLNENEYADKTQYGRYQEQLNDTEDMLRGKYEQLFLQDRYFFITCWTRANLI